MDEDVCKATMDMFIVAADAMEQERFLSSDTIVLITSLVPLFTGH